MSEVRLYGYETPYIKTKHEYRTACIFMNKKDYVYALKMNHFLSGIIDMHCQAEEILLHSPPIDIMNGKCNQQIIDIIISSVLYKMCLYQLGQYSSILTAHDVTDSTHLKDYILPLSPEAIRDFGRYGSCDAMGGQTKRVIRFFDDKSSILNTSKVIPSLATLSRLRNNLSLSLDVSLRRINFRSHSILRFTLDRNHLHRHIKQYTGRLTVLSLPLREVLCSPSVPRRKLGSRASISAKTQNGHNIVVELLVNHEKLNDEHFHTTISKMKIASELYGRTSTGEEIAHAYIHGVSDV